MQTSKKEIIDLVKSWLAISFAASMVMVGFNATLIIAIPIAALTVGVGFIAHELAHKFTAQKYGCSAEFRSFDKMLVLSILMSFFGFVFFAPGAVFIHGQVGLVRNGKISAAGPMASLGIALIFLFIMISAPLTSILMTIGRYGFIINSWIGLFNLLPFWNFDGKKIYHWNPNFYYFLSLFALIMVFSSSLF